MNIVIGIHYFPPHVGGMENVAKAQARMLAADGHRVSVLTSAVPGPAGRHAEDSYMVERLRVWNYFERAMGVPFPFFGPSLLWKSWRLARQADVIHVHDAFYMTSLALAFWGWVLRKPVVLTQHVDLIPHPKAVVRFVQRAVYRTTGRFVLYTASRIVILNSTVQQFLLGLGVPAAKLTHVPNGADLQLFHPDAQASRRELRDRYGLPQDVPVALFVGRFVPKKGFQKLLEAGSDTYHIAFAGGHAPEGYADDPRFTFLGSRTPAELAELYRAVDVFILPSQGEGFPLTVQEAMASGLPVIIGSQPGYDIYRLDPDQVLQVPPTVPAIRRVLAAVFAEPARLRAMATYSYQYAREHFSWRRNIDAMYTVYQEADQS